MGQRTCSICNTFHVYMQYNYAALSIHIIVDLIGGLMKKENPCLLTWQHHAYASSCPRVQVLTHGRSLQTMARQLLVQVLNELNKRKARSKACTKKDPVIGDYYYTCRQLHHNENIRPHLVFDPIRGALRYSYGTVIYQYQLCQCIIIMAYVELSDRQ